MPNADDRKHLHFYVEQDLYEKIKYVADERVVSVNFLLTKAVESFLERLAPVESMWKGGDPDV